VGAGGGYYFDTKVKDYASEYEVAYDSHNLQNSQTAYDNGKSAQTGRAVGYGIALGTFIIATVLWFLPEGR